MKSMRWAFMVLGFLGCPFVWGGGFGLPAQPKQDAVSSSQIEAEKYCKDYNTQQLVGLLKKTAVCNFEKISDEVKRPSLKEKTAVVVGSCQADKGRFENLKIGYALLRYAFEPEKGTESKLQGFTKDQLAKIRPQILPEPPLDAQQYSYVLRGLQSLPPELKKQLFIYGYEFMQSDCKKFYEMYVDPDPRPAGKIIRTEAK